MRKKRGQYKEIQRDTNITIRVSKEEKDLIYALAKDIGIKPTRLVRNLALSHAESKLFNKAFAIPIIKAYKEYLKITNQKEELFRIENEE